MTSLAPALPLWLERLAIAGEGGTPATTAETTPLQRPCPAVPWRLPFV